jgi:hypothetical protein
MLGVLQGASIDNLAAKLAAQDGNGAHSDTP